MNESLTRVPGVRVGHAATRSGNSGVTAILFDRPARGAVCRLTASGAISDTEVLRADHLSNEIHGICFTGGSLFGLRAASGVADVLAAAGRGKRYADKYVPHVPAAAVFDLTRSPDVPDIEDGVRAAKAATTEPVGRGRFGAACGAAAAKWTNNLTRTVLASGAIGWGDHVLGALVINNALGSIFDRRTGSWVAGSDSVDGTVPALAAVEQGHTVLVAVVTDAPLGAAGLRILSRAASHGIVRSVFPAATPVDGDVVFAVSVGPQSRIEEEERQTQVALIRMGALAAQLVEDCIVSSVASER
jgi:L-aminopeptidase/D-esterase-like protein